MSDDDDDDSGDFHVSQLEPGKDREGSPIDLPGEGSVLVDFGGPDGTAHPITAIVYEDANGEAREHQFRGLVHLATGEDGRGPFILYGAEPTARIRITTAGIEG